MKDRLISIILIAAIVVCSVAFIGIDNIRNKKAEEKVKASQTTQQNQTVEEKQKNKHQGKDIIFFGIDKSEASDSVMMFNIDDDNNVVKMASIYRDCLMHIEDHGYKKIKYAYQYGGGKLGVSTINENLDMEIKDYVAFNFQDFKELIDLVGGIEVTVTPEEAKKLKLEKDGYLTLDGETALMYSRIRKGVGGDYARTQRQRNVFFALFDKAKKMGTEDRLEFAEQMMKKVESNMPNQNVTEIMLKLSDYGIIEIGAFPEVFYGGMVDKLWVEVPRSLEKMSKEMHKQFYKDFNYEPSKTVKKYSKKLNTIGGDEIEYRYNSEENDN